ncbi:MAG: TIGR03364 family FAD-dependent oxidoreductase [Lewinella sp.]|nr:TIGR03364 family FAD-dependent oxidoreductase [Lewinella sp.]
MHHFDIAIIGGGMLGIAHAYHALEAGLKVAVIEKDPQPCGATVRNFGQIVPSGMDSRWQAYGRKSLDIYHKLQAQGEISLRQGGSIYIASDEEEMNLLEELAQINKADDYESRLLSRAECLEQYPGLRADYVLGGLYFPQEVTVDPRQAIHHITRLLWEQKGLHYFAHTWVFGIEEQGERYSLLNNRGTKIEAEKVIICSGSDFQSLYPEIFAGSPLQSVKLQMLITRPQPQRRIKGSILTGWTIRRYESFEFCPSFARVKAKEDAQAFNRQLGIHILFKQADDGSVILGDSHEYWDAGEAVDFRIDQEINDFIVGAARKIYDLDHYDIQKSWIGIYSQCKDRDVFEMEVHPNVHIVTGIGGKGMTGSLGYAEQHLNKILGR